MLLLGLAAVPLFIPPAHAIGTLYVDPPSQPVAAAKSTVTYQVKVANLDPFNGWDISVWVNGTSSLNPLSVSIAGNLMASFGTVNELVNCVNGGVGIPTGQPGNIRCGPTMSGTNVNDGPGIVHSSAVLLGSPPQTGSLSGLIFTITYNATGGPGTALHIFNDVIANGTPNPVPHTTTDGTYGSPKPDFFTTFKPTTLTIIAGRTSAVNFAFASLAFTGSVNLNATAAPAGLSVSFSNPSVKLAAWGTNSSMLIVSTGTGTPSNRYVVNVNASTGSVSHVLFVPVSVSPPRPDMYVTSLSVSPTGSVTVGQAVSVTVTVLNNGTVNGDYQLQVLWGNFVVSRPNGTLPMNDPQQLNIPWDTSRFPAGTFAVTATVVTVSGQTTRQFTGPALTLSAPPQPASVDPLLVGGVAAIIFLIVLFAFFRRKKPEEKKTKRVTR